MEGPMFLSAYLTCWYELPIRCWGCFSSNFGNWLLFTLVHLALFLANTRIQRPMFLSTFFNCGLASILEYCHLHLFSRVSHKNKLFIQKMQLIVRDYGGSLYEIFCPACFSLSPNHLSVQQYSQENTPLFFRAPILQPIAKVKALIPPLPLAMNLALITYTLVSHRRCIGEYILVTLQYRFDRVFSYREWQSRSCLWRPH